MGDGVEGGSGTPGTVMVGGWQRADGWRPSPGKWLYCLMGCALGLPGVRPAGLVPRHPSWRPLHEEIHAFIRKRGKAQPFIEPQGRVELLHMDTHGLLGDGGFSQEVTQDGGADAGVAGGRQQRDVDDADLVLPAGDSEAPHRHRVAQHEEKVRLGVAFLGALMLRRELHVQKGGFVRLVPIDEGQLIEPRAGAHLVEEGCIVGPQRAKVDRIRPTSAKGATGAGASSASAFPSRLSTCEVFHPENPLYSLEGVMHLRRDDATVAVWNAKHIPVMSVMTSGPWSPPI